MFLIVSYLLFAHWFSDFLMQDSWMGENKSHNIIALLSHTFIYSIAMGLFIAIGADCFKLFGDVYWYFPIQFSGLMFATHTIIDFISSKITSKLYKNKKYRAFFNVIGLDQLLHFITIFYALDILTT